MRRTVQGEVIASTFDRPERRAHPPRRAGHREGQADGGGRPRRRRHPRRHHPPQPGLQPGRSRDRAHHVRRHRRRRALPTEEVLRRGAEHRGGRLADHPRHRARGDELPHGRRHLRGVQGHREHGAAPRPQAGRASHLPGHRRRRLEHPPRGAAVRPQAAPAGLEAAPGAVRPGRRRQRRRRPRAADGPPQDVPHQRRVPGRDRQATVHVAACSADCGRTADGQRVRRARGRPRGRGSGPGRRYTASSPHPPGARSP